MQNTQSHRTQIETTQIEAMVEQHYGLEHLTHRVDQSLFEQALRVPLIVVAPDLPNRGGVVRRPVSLLDIYPTVVQLAGVAPVDGLDGRSLVAELMDPEGAGEEGTVLSYRRIHAPRRAWSLRTATARYTLWPDGSEECTGPLEAGSVWTVRQGEGVSGSTPFVQADGGGR